MWFWQTSTFVMLFIYWATWHQQHTRNNKKKSAVDVIEPQWPDYIYNRKLCRDYKGHMWNSTTTSNYITISWQCTVKGQDKISTETQNASETITAVTLLINKPASNSHNAWNVVHPNIYSTHTHIHTQYRWHYVHTDGEWSATTLLVLKRRVVTLSGTSIEIETGVKLALDLNTHIHMFTEQKSNLLDHKSILLLHRTM